MTKFMQSTGQFNRWGILCALFWSVATGPVQALSEVELADGYTTQLLDYMANEGKRSTFTTTDGAVIHYQRFDQDCNQTAIIILPGWSEPYLKYAEVVYDLRAKHYCVYTMDYRGQGLSSRVVNNSQMSHVEDFSSYVRDLDYFYRQEILPRSYQKVFVLAHSMGGLVATLFANEKPGQLDGVIMIAPMFGIHTGAWPPWLAYGIVSVLDWLGLGESFVLGHGQWQETPFARNRQTNSAVRYQYGVDLFLQNESLIIGGVSNRWLKTSMDYGRKAVRLAPQINSKFLVFEAQNDSFVLSEPIRRFCRLAQQCESVYLQNAKHELLMETDVIRDEVFAKIYKFIKE